MIQNVFRAEGLPLDLAYVPLIESAFKPTALSRAKARGVWQFMRGTAIENGLRRIGTSTSGPTRRRPRSPRRNTSRRSTACSTTGTSPWRPTTAGPGRVQRAMKRSRKDDFWDLTSTTRYLPRETRDYVPMILAAIIIAKNPVNTASTSRRSRADADRERDLAAGRRSPPRRRMGGRRRDDIQQLNPELRRWTTPIIGEGSYALRSPPAPRADRRGPSGRRAARS